MAGKNQLGIGGVLLVNGMDGYADTLAAGLVRANEDVERVFEAGLAESTTLAFRVAFSVLRQRQDAEDVAQEALVKAHANIRQLRDRDRLRAWLVRLTWRLAIDRRRADLRRATRESLHALDRTVTSHPEDPDASARAVALWQAVDALPDKLRVVVVLANIEEHSIDDVARLLDVPAGTVKSRLFQARARLKEQLSCVLGTNPLTK